MLRLHLLGTGSPAPLPERQGSAVLLSLNHDHMLFDAGRGVTTQLGRAGVAPHELSAIFLTHHHYDHIGNLGDLLLTAWHGGSTSLPLIGPPGTQQIVQALFQQVYHRELAFAAALDRATGSAKPDIQSVVSVTTLDPGQQYQQGAWRITAAAVEHGLGLGLTYEEWPCFAYRIDVQGRSVVISGDTVACASLIALAQGADVLVQCCFLADFELTTPARRLLAEQVIATSGQAGKIATQAGVKTLVLTHFNAMAPEMLAAIEQDVRRDFSGQLSMGRDLLALDL